ncbi:NRAMP family divalent metal transporter [Natronobacterium gregoryi]|uniref:Divalent metal cation transporter n=2 Tax=Natronobacterium gregoryi TaxID=44930 RepID=L0AGQ1_NATGS|nr:divalent metal cation transporter [Natronobacterium gregoryi]AFZ72337.1 Mn2+/Fe2- transporter, NRAMP family [Natronobacterium gregoryi SP2]ELY64277.1 natural resistance-associated macrophage protein [Natronobacterium gregoryi SP2]PLK20346.1 divalent metal cation transporter [Natronobacterium gregoryi SP2]SFJ23178.1 manganese transport protein [Natronobacterium gregoryi]
MATETHQEERTGGRVLGFVRRLGPTWLAGAIAAGPATMVSLLVAGASFGYALLWVVVLSAVLGTVGQYLAMRLGLLTEQGIVAVVEEHLGSFWAWVLVIDVVLAAGLAQLVIMKTLADVSATIFTTAGVPALADPRLWGVTWAVILALGLAGGGYRIAEIGAKVIVSLVVLAFVASVFVVPIDPTAAATGLVPGIPGVGGAVVAAGVLGGAVHITLLTMQSYTMRARGWTDDDSDIAVFDVVSSMLVAFGVFSLAVFLVAASVLPEAGVDPATIDEIQAAQALGPIAGEHAVWLFLLGLWGAAVSTLGGNTIVPPYLVADKLGWEQSVEDRRYRGALVAVALASAVGAFLEGAFFQLLVLVLAFGLVGTPFALAVILYLLNDPDVVPETNSRLANLGGVVLFAVASVLAGEFVLEELETVTEPMSAFVVAFAAAMTLAIVGLAVRYVRERHRNN